MPLFFESNMFLVQLIRKQYTIKVILLTFIVIGAIIITKPNVEEDYCEALGVVSCHYTVIEDDLPPFEKLYTDKNEENLGKNVRRSIFYHETSCKGDLGLRQACSVESAARAHPSWDIHVLFSAPVPRARMFTAGSGVASIQGLSNVKLWRVHIQDFVRGTPLEDVVNSGRLNSSCFPTVHTADLLRLVTVYKHPGVYLDLDIIVVKPLGPLGTNYLVREADHAVSSAVIAFAADDTGRSMAFEVAREMAVSYNGSVYAINGPALMLRVLKRRCRTERPVDMNTFTCQGLSVYGQETAYPVHHSNRTEYFTPVDATEIPGSYHTHMHHMWNQLTHTWPIPPNSVFHHLAVKYCPQVYRRGAKEFWG